MEVKLTGKELIETLNKNFIGKRVGFAVNGVFWSGELEILEVKEFCTSYESKGVHFYIFNHEEYFYSFEHKAFLKIEEV